MTLTILIWLYVLFLIVFSFLRPKQGLFFFLGTKFTVDLLWEISILPGVNALKIIGVLFPVLMIAWTWRHRKSIVPHPLLPVTAILIALNVLSAAWGLANSYWYFFPLAASPIGWIHTGDWFFRLLNQMTALILVPLILSPRDIPALSRAVLLSTVVPGLIGAWQILTTSQEIASKAIHEAYSVNIFPRISGGYHDPGGLAIAMFSGCIFAFLLYRASPKRADRAWSILHLILCSVVLYFTFSRAMWLSISAFFLFLFALEKRPRLILITLAIGIGVVFLLPLTVKRFEKELTLLRAPQRLLSEHREIERLGSGRLWLWNDARKHFEKLDVISKTIGSGGSYGSHNQYVSVLLKNGIAGFSFFLFFLYRTGTRIRKYENRSRSPLSHFGWSLFLTVTLLSNLFLQPWDHLTFSIVFWSVIGVMTYHSDSGMEAENPVTHSNVPRCT